jgi:pimeloyl-ACP methyl ester carboxylesterase
MFAANDDLESWLLEGRLGEIETPVDLLWGEADRYLGADFVPRLLSGLPRARITPVPRCGHLPQAECPERFRELLEAVLAMEPPGEAPHPG